MNREHEQKGEITAASVSLVMSQNFTEALEGKLEERVKRGNKMKKSEGNCLKKSMIFVTGGQYLCFTCEQDFGEVSALWKNQRIHGMKGCHPEILLCCSLATESKK